ncbi:MAG: arsenate reductase ArsC [Acidobacteria bacterium]|nr:arsenate reductase ArsC [Acidobacteriota bacterium]MCA1609419.1 arsenate reductase ArsC [Acidobacteriota bacterium]
MLQPVNDDPAAQESPTARTPRVLFLCTGNSARSQIAEALLRHLGGDAFDVFSAGSRPRPAIHPLAREAANDLFGLDMAGQHPKGLDEVAGPFDWIISVCDHAADSCPILPSTGSTIRWSLADPAGAPGGDEEKRCAFRQTALELHRRIEAWLASTGVPEGRGSSSRGR